MTTPQTSAYLARLFEEHGLSCVVEKDWDLPNAKLPALRALWYPGESSGRLDVHVLVSDDIVFEESFAGAGQAETGLNDALANFTVNSFHVLLAALWGRNDASQVTTEEWEVSGQHYTAYVGSFGTRSTEGVTPHIPSNLFAAIAETIQSEHLTEGVHWFRFFFCNVGGDYAFEALKNNEVWDAGLRCLKASSWEKSNGYYSVRLFIVLRAGLTPIESTSGWLSLSPPRTAGVSRLEMGKLTAVWFKVTDLFAWLLIAFSVVASLAYPLVGPVYERMADQPSSTLDIVGTSVLWLAVALGAFAITRRRAFGIALVLLPALALVTSGRTLAALLVSAGFVLAFGTPFLLALIHAAKRGNL